MKKIYKFNQYLLEKYPTIWNTKIVWMLLASIIVHLFFFMIGYFSHSNPLSLQKYGVINDYFGDGVIFIHLIISILMIVGWLIMMFKNNAFKNFYPSSGLKLFGQFIQYFIIIFACTTFFFSYMFGFKTFIKNKYPDQKMAEKIEVINKAYPFFSQQLENYTLDNRVFSKFPDIYCEKDKEKIDYNKKYFVYYDRFYQYYTVYSKTVYQKDIYGDYIFPHNEEKDNLAYSKENENSEVFYFKKEVVDLSPYIATTGLTYYNFSNIFYLNNLAERSYLRSVSYEKQPLEQEEAVLLKKKELEISNSTAELLNKKDPEAIEKLMKDFLDISKEFGIPNNLDAKSWMKLVYYPDLFEVHNFIKTYKNKVGEEYNVNRNDYHYGQGEDSSLAVDYTTVAVDSVALVDEEQTLHKDINIKPDVSRQIAPEVYFKKNLTNYYYNTENLKDMLINVDIIKSTDFFSESIHIYIWIAFFLSTCIFSFRITGLKSLLFSIISAGVIILGVVLVIVLYTSIIGNRSNEKFFVSYFVLGISVVILLIPLLLLKRVSKLISSIFINISMNGFVLFVFLIFGIISLHQTEYCEALGVYYKCVTIIDTLGLGLSYIILACGFVFMYLYTFLLQKWKSLPQ